MGNVHGQTSGGHGGHGPVETVEVVVCIVVTTADARADQTDSGGPGTTMAGSGPTAKDVPQTGHKVGADGYEDSELDQSQ